MALWPRAQPDDINDGTDLGDSDAALCPVTFGAGGGPPLHTSSLGFERGPSVTAPPISGGETAGMRALDCAAWDVCARRRASTYITQSRAYTERRKK